MAKQTEDHQILKIAALERRLKTGLTLRREKHHIIAEIIEILEHSNVHLAQNLLWELIAIISKDPSLLENDFIIIAKPKPRQQTKRSKG